MNKDLNVIFPDEIYAGDVVCISLVLEKAGPKDKDFENIEFFTLEITNLLKGETHLITSKIGDPTTSEELPHDGKFRSVTSEDPLRQEYLWNLSSPFEFPGIYEAKVTSNGEGLEIVHAGPIRFKVNAGERTTTSLEPVKVTMQEANRFSTPDQLLWVLIRNRTVDFNKYQAFIDNVMCNSNGGGGLSNEAKRNMSNRLPYHNSASYSLLKYATEHYLMQECGMVPMDLSRDTNWDDLNTVLTSYSSIENELRRTGRSELDLSRLKDEYLERLGEEGGYALPYFKIIQQKLREIPLKDVHEIPLHGRFRSTEDFSSNACYGILKSKLVGPCMIELIWSYWHEEGGLIQTMNALSSRFQNVRNPSGTNPLANLNMDPLRPLNNLLWGYIEDERNRLSIVRRNLEYQYEYGLSLIGKAVPHVEVVESRSQFLKGFHNLLKMCIEFYNQANYTTVIPDGFPLLNHLREVHLLLAEGAHNQFGDLPTTSRIEMLTQQWLLARPEMREFIGGRTMVPYAEAWMDKVDTVKSLHDWNDTNITHFRDLGVYGEQLMLSIRYGNWNAAGIGAQNAANWAHYWREEIQRYVHAYKAVTGVDVSSDAGNLRSFAVDTEDRYVQPSLLIQKQTLMQKGKKQQQLAISSNETIQPMAARVRQQRMING